MPFDDLTDEIQALKKEVTRLKKIQKLNTETERKYRDLVEGSKLGIMVHRDFNFIFVNSMFAEIFGYDDVDDIMANKSILNLVPAHTVKLFEKYMDDRLNGRHAPTFFEFEGTRKDGSTIWLENVVRIVTWDGAPAVQITIIDITERKLAQIKLGESEERFRIYAALGADWMWETDQEDRFSYVSDSFYEKMDVRPDDVIGSPRTNWINDFDLTDQPSKWQSHFSKIKNQLPFEDLEFLQISTDNINHYIRMSGVPAYSKDGAFSGYHGIARDITLRYETDRLKSEFVSTVSHELRTPLTTIKGALGLLASGTYGEIPSDIIEIIQLADRNASQLTDLVNDLLDMEKIKKGDLQFNMSAVDLGEIITESVEINRPHAEHCNISVVHTDTLDEAFVWGDRDRLKQVLGNLLSNATKFSPNGETVHIKLVKIADSYRLSVSDNGDGIPDQFKETLFQAFSQADSTDTRLKGGIGLGLNIAKSIIDRHQGRLGVHSTENKGSQFYFELQARSN